MLENAVRHSGPEDIVAAIRMVGGEPAAVAEVVAHLVRSPEVLDRMLGADDRCGIRVLASASDLTVQRVVWPAGIRIPPHDHRMWAVVGVSRGTEDNRLFVRERGSVFETGACRIEQGAVLTLLPDAIHAVANPAPTPCVALHVYGGDLDSTPRSAWTPDGAELAFDPAATWRAVTSFGAEEDRLGRPLRYAETQRLLAGLAGEPPSAA